MNLLDLNSDVLLLIFRYCNLHDLYNFYSACKKFREILNYHVFRRINLDQIITSCDENNWLNHRTGHYLSIKQRCQLHDNICAGKYEERVLFKHQKFYVSCIHLEADHLYMSHKGQIHVHKRNGLNDKYELQLRTQHRISNMQESDVTSMRKIGNTLFAGRSNGHAFIYNTDYPEEALSEEKIFSNGESIKSVDFFANLFVATSRKATSFLKLDTELGVNYFSTVFDLDEPFECLRIQPSHELVAVGKYHDSLGLALRLIDIESGLISNTTDSTKSIYDLAWKDNNCILSGNFDTTLRVTDIRTNCDCQYWEDPYNASVYCLDYDGMNGVFCGMKYNYRVNLYDLRVPKKVVQMYFPKRLGSGFCTSPAYAVACDASELFVVTDHSLRLFNFRTSRSESRDYST